MEEKVTSTCCSKPCRCGLCVVLGLVLLTGAVWVGIQIGRGQYSLPIGFPKPTPSLIPIDNGPVEIEVSPTPNVTADWKTYKNDKYGFELKYPKDYFIDPFSTLQSVSFIRESYKEMGQFPSVSLSLATTQEELEVFIQKKQTELLKGWQSFKKESGAYEGTPDPRIISISDYQRGTIIAAKKVERIGPPNAPQQDYTEFYFKHRNIIFVLSANDSDEVQTLVGMVYTFKFLD